MEFCLSSQPHSKQSPHACPYSQSSKLTYSASQTSQLSIIIPSPNNIIKAYTKKTLSTNMDPNQQQLQEQLGQPNKKIKLEKKQQNDADGWIVVKPKYADLTISICDFSRINRYYGHRSIQGYLRYILAQSVPNPMWLSIKRQSLIEQIIYIDLEIECNLFEKMIANKELSFLAQITNQTNKALFKPANKVFRQDIWECLLCCQNQQDIKEIHQIKIEQLKIDENLYKKYLKYTLTPEQLKLHLYPNKELPIYSDFYQIKNQNTTNQQWKNKILIIDCEMVSSEAGFELARTTIANFQGQIIFDQLFKPQVQIINYNTQYSGITEELISHITNTQQNKLYPFLQSILTKDTILVGHSLQNDLRAMKLIHSRVIDSSVLFMRKNGSKFKLKNLADRILKRKIQVGQHDSKQDCLATLDLVRAKIQNQETIKKKDYTLFKELQSSKKNAALIDYAIDYEMKEFNSNHYQKVQKYEISANLFKIMRKYLRRDVAIPNLILTRIQRNPQINWQVYYRQFDQSFRQLHSAIPKKTIIFLNCQVDTSVQILTAGQTMKTTSSIRNPCFTLAV